MKKPEVKKEKEKTTLRNPPAATQTGLPTVFDSAKYAGAGHDEAGREAYMIPFLVILQTNSPQCLEGDPAYVKGAKAGGFYNTATKAVYDGKTGVKAIMCYYQRKGIEWAPRDSGGGYRGEHSMEKFDAGEIERDDSGKYPLENGNYVSDTRYHYLLQLTQNGAEKVVMGLASTQLRPSREWMTALRTYRVTDDRGKLMVAPTFMFICKLTTVDKSNEKGRWKLLKVEIDQALNNKDKKDIDLLIEGAGFYEQVKGGFVKPKYEEADNPDITDAPPF
jgi:hypothetical protein